MSNAAAASADADVNAIETMLQSPQISELNRLKELRIRRLENDLQQNAEQEERERHAQMRASQIREQIRFLQEGMRKPISEKNIRTRWC